MNILQLSAHFHPNIGGIETHLTDLTEGLAKRGHQVTVLTYRPLVSKKRWKIYETVQSLTIIRIPWIPGLFYKLVKFPILEFIYLLPGLFIFTPFVLFLKNPQVIHAHGLVAGFVAVFWGKLFNKKVIVSTHSIYSFPEKGLYRNFVHWIFKNSHLVSGLSKLAVLEIISLGISPTKVKLFTYWLDLNKFIKKDNKQEIKEELGWDKKFTVLFVGRLVSEKGIEELLSAAKSWDKKIQLVIIGSGPLENLIKKFEDNEKIKYLGRIEQDKLYLYYNGADISIIPSVSEEGFGRVIMESLACGTPVIGAKRGAIPEAMDETVGRFLNVDPQSIKNEVEYLLNHPEVLKKLASKTRSFVERRYSEKNIEIIIDSYKQ